MPNITAKIIKKGAEGKGYLSGVEVKCSTGVVQPLTIDKPPPNCEIEVKTALIPDCGECANPCGYNVLVKIDTTANNTCEGKGAPPCGDELNPSGIEIDCLNKKLDTSPLGVCKSLCESKYPSDVKWVSYESSGSEEDCEREKNLDDCMDCCSNGCPDDTNGDCIENCIECKNKCPDETSTGNCETTHCKENCNECVDKCGSDEECIKECGNCIDECMASGQYAYLKNPSLERQVCACSECKARCTCNAYITCSGVHSEVDDNGCGCFTDGCGKRRCCPIDVGWGGDILGSQNPPGCESDCFKRCRALLESADETRQTSCYTDCIDEMNALYELCPCEIEISYPNNNEISCGDSAFPNLIESGLCNCDKFEYKLLSGNGSLNPVSGIFIAPTGEDCNCDPVKIQACCTNCNDSETCSDPVTLTYRDIAGCCVEGADCSIICGDPNDSCGITMDNNDTLQLEVTGNACDPLNVYFTVEGADVEISSNGLIETGPDACGQITVKLWCGISNPVLLDTCKVKISTGVWTTLVDCHAPMAGACVPRGCTENDSCNQRTSIVCCINEVWDCAANWSNYGDCPDPTACVPDPCPAGKRSCGTIRDILKIWECA